MINDKYKVSFIEINYIWGKDESRCIADSNWNLFSVEPYNSRIGN